MSILIIIFLIVVFVGLVLFLLSKVKEEQAPEEKELTREERKRTEGTWFGGHEV